MSGGKKLKIAIITIYGEENYGNKLQNYAIKKMIENIIDNSVYTIKPKQTIKQKILNILSKLHIGKYKHLKKDCFDQRKMSNFKTFSKKYLNVTKYNTLNKLNEEYDLFFVGSDQVWNTNGFKGKLLDYFLLSFVDDHKRIAIAPSLGTGKIGEKQIKQFEKELSKFDKLSCRENSGVHQIEKYSNGKKCIKLSDPTMGLTKNDWEKIRKKAQKKPTNKFIFCYFLGRVDEKLESIISKFKSEYIIVNIMKKEDIELFSNDPGQFIDLLADASLVLTDSFHGCVFSIIYNKPFIVVHTPNRINMEDRINSLLNEFQLEDRWVDNINFNINYVDVDFTYANQKLSKEYVKLNDYIKEALNV